MMNGNNQPDPLSLYRYFNALKLHFGTSYDIRKYAYSNRRFNLEKFEKDHARSVYYAMSNKYPSDEYAKEVFAANLVRDSAIHVTRVNEELGLTLRRYNANKVLLFDDVKQLISSGLLTDIKNDDIIDRIVSGNISIEIITFLSRLIPIKELIEANTSNKFMWELVKGKINKYEPMCLLNSIEQRDSLKHAVLTELHNYR